MDLLITTGIPFYNGGREEVFVTMQIEIKMDAAYAEPKVIVLTAEMTEEVTRLVQKLTENNPQIISGSKAERIAVLEQSEMIRIYAANSKVFAVTDSGEYTLRLRLYEVEERLDPNQFVRISGSEIVNLKKVKNFDLSFAGTICVELMNGTSSFVSRRYVSKIKKILGI